MTIAALEYEDMQRRWKLERTEFGPFNLLVGLSGAGKTSVLDALLEVSAMGLRQPGARYPGGERRWCIEVQADTGQHYRWEAEVVVSSAQREFRHVTFNLRNDASFRWPVRFLRERISVSMDGAGSQIVTREADEFRFLGNSLPRLKDDESAISLLEDEDIIAPLHRALERIMTSDSTKPYGWTAYPSDGPNLGWGEDSPPISADALREDRARPIVLKANFARQKFPELFDSIRSHYLEIFDNVADLTTNLASELDPTEALQPQDWFGPSITIAIKERGSDSWITARHMSSGMLRTFFHLAELELAPRGTTIVIDEYENSMGVNCLPAITEMFLRRQHELQFVFTSHHPYVIQNIPVDWWRVVTRRGGVVSVRPAREIPELSTSSRQDAFTLLVNSSVYEEGIQ